MANLPQNVQRFIQNYGKEYKALKQSAAYLEDFVKNILGTTNIEIHAIVARAKDLDSVVQKIRDKGYTKPRQQMTDTIGVRVITYYADDIDKVVEVLKESLKVNKSKSIDRRLLRDIRAFGYSSVHLVVKMRKSEIVAGEFSVLKERWFEIQVRSILEHAWAEIEHQIIYKSKTKYPRNIDRSFAAIAGTLEILGKEFSSLRKAHDELVLVYRGRYEEGKEMSKKLDVARLLGLLEAELPDGLGWRKAREGEAPFLVGSEKNALEALSNVGIKTARALQKVIQEPRFKKGIKAFAKAEGLDEKQVSHLATVIIAVGIRDKGVFEEYFPGMLQDASLQAALKS